MTVTAFPGRVIFDHQPKTGGMAVAHWLRDVLGSGCVTNSIYGEHTELIRLHGGLQSIIAAHVRFDNGDDLDPRYQYVTCFREPLDRALSWIFHVLHDAHVDENSIVLKREIPRFLETDGNYCPPELLQTISNIYTKHLCRINNTKKLTEDEEILHSISMIKRFDIVGIYEKNSEFIANFAKLVGIDPPNSIQRVNVTTRRPQVDEISPALRERLVSWNQTDLRFYSELLKMTELVSSSGWQRYERKRVLIKKATGSMSIVNIKKNMKSGEFNLITVKVSNDSQDNWSTGTNNSVCASYHWLKTSGEVHTFEGKRSLIPDSGIGPGKRESFDMTVISPMEPGTYRLVITLLQEGSAWLENIGFQPAVTEIEVS